MEREGQIQKSTRDPASNEIKAKRDRNHRKEREKYS